MDAPTLGEVSNSTASWFPVVTLLLGFALNAFTESIRRRHELKRDRESRLEARRDHVLEQRRNFQRDTLLALQEAIADLARATGAAHHQNEMNYRKTGEWQNQLLSDDLDQANLLAMRRTGILEVRVRDAQLRQLVKEFRGHCAAEEVSGRDRNISNQ